MFGPSVLFDAGGALGYLAAHEAMKLALRKAASRGLSLVGVRSAGHSGMLAYYARLALERDYIGVALCNTRPMVAAYGGIEAVFGTNPLAVAIPAERIPLVLDMSTSRVTYGDLLVAGKLGRKIRPGSALDAEGRITEDPDEAREGALLPFG